MRGWVDRVRRMRRRPFMEGSVGRPSRAMERLLELLSWPNVFWLSPYVLPWGSKSLQAASQKALKLIPEHLLL